jgi:4-hydroxybenzoate polyprenyltransferase/phosphoserine phosphatase
MTRVEGGLPIPLAIDLDGTLIHSDLLHESVLYLFKVKPWLIFFLPYWLLKGKARLKSELAKVIEFPIDSLPYNKELILYIQEQRGLGRKIILCTASNQDFAQSIADHLGIFDEVLASNEHVNLAGIVKAKTLSNRYGDKGFDYAGNSHADLPVWARAKSAIVVNGASSLIKKTRSFEVKKTFPRPIRGFKSWVKVFRLHQWVKNILIFIPAVAAHAVITVDGWKDLILAFLSFSLCASFVYVINDLLDLESDRRHPRKRYRPFASGQIPIWIGAVLAPVLILSSIFLAADVGMSFLYWLLVYLALTTLYSWGLKRFVIVDVLTLAILYTLRIVAGAAAMEMPLSFWILAFSVFLFLSLAFIKRDAELQSHDGGRREIHGRGYVTSDASLIQQLGVSSGYTAVLVLALYINSENVIKLYRAPEMIWGAVPLLLWWLSWMWFQANRGLMHDDPIVFAIKDKISLIIGVLFLGAFALAR